MQRASARLINDLNPPRKLFKGLGVGCGAGSWRALPARMDFTHHDGSVAADISSPRATLEPVGWGGSKRGTASLDAEPLRIIEGTDRELHESRKQGSCYRFNILSVCAQECLQLRP